MFLRSNLAQSGLAYAEAPYHGDYYAALAPNGSIAGVLAHFWNGFIATQSPDLSLQNKIADYLARTSTRKIGGFSGPPDQVNHLINRLNLSTAPFALNHAEALFALELEALQIPSEAADAGFNLTGAEHIERAILNEWMQAYDIEALGNQPGNALDARVSERVDGMINTIGNHWVLCHDGTPVSLCGLNARVGDCVQIGPVWTPPTHRNKGFARIGLALALVEASKQGISRALLFTDNPAARTAYEALGFVQNGHFHLAILKAPVTLTGS